MSTIRDWVTSTLCQVPVLKPPILVCRADPLTLLSTNTLELESIQMPTCRFPISMMLSLLEPTESALNSRETLYSFPNFERVSSRLFLVGVISRNIEFILFSPSLPPWPRFTCGGSELDQIKTGHVKFYQIQHPSRLYVLCRYQVTLSKANCVCRMVKQKYGTETFIVICIMYLLIEENVFAMSETLNWVGGGKFETV